MFCVQVVLAYFVVMKQLRNCDFTTFEYTGALYNISRTLSIKKKTDDDGAIQDMKFPISHDKRSIRGISGCQFLRPFPSMRRGKDPPV